MAKTEEMVFKASPARVFNACRVAMAQLSYTLISADETGRIISFNTGRSLKSFAGQDLQATVLDNGDGSRVIVGGTIARRGGMGSGQQIAWGEKASLSKKFLAEVESVLPNVPEIDQINDIQRRGVSIIEVDKGDTRTCPFCAETIKSAAIKCRFCGSAIEPISRDEPEPSPIEEIQIAHTQLVTDHEVAVDIEPEEGPMSDPEEQTPPVIPSSTDLSAKWYRGKKGTAVISIVLAVIIATSIFVVTQVESKTGHFSGHSSGWSAVRDVDPGSKSNLGISSNSCPTTSFCMAVDSNGRSLSYSRGKWSAPDSIDPYGILNSVSCPTTSFCMAVDSNGVSLSYFNGKWSKPDTIDPQSSTTGNGLGMSSVSCPTTSFCMAVDDLGNALSYDNGKWSAPDSIDPQSAKNHNAGTFGLTSVSCPTTSFCMAVDVLGNALSYDNGRWSAPDSIDPQSSTAGNGNGMSSVSCPTTSFCMAVDADGGSLNYIAGKWSAPDSIGGILNSVSCPTTSFCMALDLGDALSYSNGKWSAPDSIGGILNSVSCPTRSFCMAVDQNGNSLSYKSVAQPKS
jgi:hypothetical protein